MNKKPFTIAFITAGDPDAASTAAYIAALEKGGASVMELAVPFSDPTAEGEEIQESFVRALKGGMSVEKTFEILEQVRKNSDVPVILRSYLNPVLRYGYQKFFRRCAQLGVCALDVPDLPFEEREEVQPYARENCVDIIMHAASADGERLRGIALSARGYLFAESARAAREARRFAKAPVVLTAQNAREAALAAADADGVCTGSGVAGITAALGAHAEGALEKYMADMIAAL